MTEKRNESRLHLCWLVFLGIILIRGFAGGGINMTSGLFLAPVAEEIGVGIGSLSIYFSIISVVMVLWLPMAGRLINRYDIRVMAIAGAVLQAVPFALLGLLNQVYGWYIMAVPMAMGATILVSLLGPILINRWFARHAGLMMGLQMAFVGIFGAILQPYASNLIVSDGWRRTYMIIGGLTFIAVVVSALILLRNRPEDRGLKPYGAGMMQQEKQENNAVSSGGQIEIAEAEAVRSASFYLLLFFMIAITGVGVFTQHIPTFSGMRGFTMEQTGNALAFTSLGNAVGSVVIGFVCD